MNFVVVHTVHLPHVWFLSGGGGGLLVCRLDNPSLATEKESRLLLYQNLDSDLDNLSCAEKLAKAQFASKKSVFTFFLHVWSLLTSFCSPACSLSKCFGTQPNHPSSVFSYSLDGCVC